MPLEDPPESKLSGFRLLTVAGAEDQYGRFAPRLNEWARACGAGLDAHVLATGHDLSPEDLGVARNWLGRARQPAASR